MSSEYFYFSASLPSIELKGTPHLTMAKFREDCERLLNRMDYEDIQALLSDFSDGSEPRNPFARRWKEYLHRFRNQAVKIRAGEMGLEAMPHLRGDREADPYAIEILSQAVKAADPLSAEELIAEAQWRKADEMTQGHHFDFEVILAFAIKLRILERFKKIDSPKGREMLEQYKSEAVTVR